MISPKSQRKGSSTNDVLDDNLPPWPEWSDHFLNRVRWNGKPLKPRRDSSQPSKVSSQSQLVESCYEDPAGLVPMPSDVPVSTWVRPQQMYPDIRTFVVDPDPLPLDLLQHNRHLLDFKIMRMIISSIACLERESFYRPFPVEFQSERFVFTEGWHWQPWQHVYALTSAGKGETHKPKYNSHGKYIIRIFYTGKWRRVYVDDRLPVSVEGQLLLPTSRPDNLWLPLLSKALLKVAALSWQPGTHNVDFTVVHCLTGWIPTSIVCKGCSEYQLWCICCKLMPSTSEVVRSPGGCISDLAFKCPLDDTLTHLEATESQVIIGFITDLFLRRSRRATGIVTSQERQVLFSNVRYNKESPNPLWKKYRWEEWAYNKGIISDVKTKPVRSVQILNPLRAALPPNIVPEINNDQDNYQEFWVDFDLIIQLTRTLEVYYKPSYFKYNLRAWNVADMLLPVVSVEDANPADGRKLPAGKKSPATSNKSPKNTAKSKDGTIGDKKTMKEKGTKKKDTTSAFPNWPENIKKQSFFYLMIDSMFCKQLYICLSGYDPYKQPSYAHVVFGKFEWHRPTVAPIIFMMSTAGTKGYTIPLSPGRHVFRVWHQVPDNFCLQIFSNTKFSTGSKMQIQQALTSDTASYQHYGEEISNSMAELLGVKQGGVEHGKAYDQLMNSLMPPQLRSQLTWPHWSRVYTDLTQVFEECLTEMLVESMHSFEDTYQIVQAFQMLFLNPVFGENILLTLKSEFYYYIKKRKRSIYEKENATILVVEESLKKGKNKGGTKEKSKSPSKSPSEKTNKTKFGKGIQTATAQPLRTLLKCKETSLLLTNAGNAIVLLKKMMAKLPNLRQLYPFSFEDDYTLVYQDYLGRFEAKEKWVVLVRCVFNTHATLEVPCSLHIWAPLQKMLFRLIDNDTLKDIPLGFMENNINYLSRNEEGYTFCVYGVADSSSIDWRLRSIGVREGDMLHICQGPECQMLNIQPPEQFQQTLQAFYLPNKEKLIARCFLDVYEDVTVLMRLQLSKPDVFCSFAIRLAGETVESTTGIGHIIIPILKLKGKGIEKEGSSHGDSSSNLIENRARYQIEVKLLNDSWPLTLEQVKAMHYYKEHMFDASLEQTQTDEGFNTDSNLSLFENVEKPSWTLTVVCDLKKEMPVKLLHDTSLSDQLKEITSKWQEQNIDLDACKELRQNISNKLADCSEEDWSERNVFHLKASKTNHLIELYGRKQSEISSTESIVNSIHESRSSNKISLCSHSPSKRLSHTCSNLTQISNGPDRSSASTGDLSDTNVILTQQAGIHKTLELIRERNQKILAARLEEALDFRTQVFDSISSRNKTKEGKDKAESTLKKAKDDRTLKSKSSKVPKSKK